MVEGMRKKLFFNNSVQFWEQNKQFFKTGLWGGNEVKRKMTIVS